jgi:hypothetical protein
MAKASKKSTPIRTRKPIFAGACLKPADAHSFIKGLKANIRTELAAARARAEEAERVLKAVHDPGGRPPKYVAIIDDATRKIETGAVIPTRNGLTCFVRRIAPSEDAVPTIRHNLRAVWNAHLKK